MGRLRSESTFAYPQATAAARLEAEVLAQELGGRLGPLLGAGTTGQGRFQQPATISFDGAYGTPQAAEVEVTVNVNLRYRLLRR